MNTRTLSTGLIVSAFLLSAFLSCNSTTETAKVTVNVNMYANNRIMEHSP